MAFDKAKAIRAAEKHLAQGKVPAAIEEYRRIVEQDAEDFTSLNTLGDLYVRTGKTQDAVKCFRSVAEHYRVQGFALKAVAMYKKVTRYVPEDAVVAVALASLYEQQGLLVEARAQYLTVGDLLARRGSTREALEVLQRVADLDPNNTDIRLRLAEGLEREDLPDLSAQAYTEAGDRLAARGRYEPALDAYNRALAMRPQSHAALQGLLAAHAALGTADEAAEVVERAVAAQPGDLELRAMLVRAYVEAEDAARAEQAADELVTRDQTSYAYFFDVARLCLRQKEADRAVSLLGRVVETALTGREDGQLLELLDEALRRDPEHTGALRLLVRIYEWQRNDSRLRSTLERLAEAAEASGAEEEERKALTHLMRLGHDEPRHRERLELLGGPPDSEFDAEPPEPEWPAAPAQSDEVPTFESFMLSDEPAPQEPASGQAAAADVQDFTFETFAPREPEPSAPDPNASFADLNEDFSDVPAGAAEPASAFADFQDVDFGAHVGEASAPAAHGDPRVRMLGQELESVDFYIAQGYTDIARDTLDMLERQYGPDPGIEERRGRLPSAPGAELLVETVVAAEPLASVGALSVEEVETAFVGFTAEAPARANGNGNGRGAARQESQPGARGGLDPGLVAIFDEFREAVEEDVEPQDESDFEGHYNMGLAYKDIEMLDQAVEAFQQAIQTTSHGDGTPRYLQCCNMLGHCFMRKGMPKLAAMWFRKGLDAPGHTEDEYQALRFELATAYEQMGDHARALDIFTEVYGIDVTYRGVADKLRELQEQQQAVAND